MLRTRMTILIKWFTEQVRHPLFNAWYIWRCNYILQEIIVCKSDVEFKLFLTAKIGIFKWLIILYKRVRPDLFFLYSLSITTYSIVISNIFAFFFLREERKRELLTRIWRVGGGCIFCVSRSHFHARHAAHRRQNKTCMMQLKRKAN